MATANEKQPGGRHYKVRQGEEEHWDRMWRMFGRSWFIGNITKYTERAHKKGGFKDIVKIWHYLQKWTELEMAATQGRGVLPGGGDKSLTSEGLTEMQDWLRELGLLPQEKKAAVASDKDDGMEYDKNGEPVRCPHGVHIPKVKCNGLCKDCDYLSTTIGEAS
jgi:hypothetical protein